METKEFKKITKYDDYTINEFVKGIVEARKDFNDIVGDRDSKIAEIDAKISELNSKNTKQMTEEEKEELKAEKAKYRQEKSNYGKEKTQAKNYLAKWEKEKERIINKLNQKIEENEKKIDENRLKIQEYENEIKENETKLEGMDQKSKEYEELVMANRALHKKISTKTGVITRYDNKINHLKEVEGNLENENVLEGLKPPRDLKSKPTTLTFNEKYKAYIDKKARETGYYANARTSEEDASFRTLVEEEQKIKDRKAAEEKLNAETAKKEAEKGQEPKAKPTNNEAANKNKTNVEPTNNETANKNKTNVEPTNNETANKNNETGNKNNETGNKNKANAEPTNKEQVTEAKNRVGEEKMDNKDETKIQWHPKLTQEQIDDLRAEGLEPGDNEYNLYLWNHGINPFEKEAEAAKVGEISDEDFDRAIDEAISLSKQQKEKDVEEDIGAVIDDILSEFSDKVKKEEMQTNETRENLLEVEHRELSEEEFEKQLDDIFKAQSQTKNNVMEQDPPKKETKTNKVKAFFKKIWGAITREIDILEEKLRITKRLPEQTTATPEKTDREKFVKTVVNRNETFDPIEFLEEQDQAKQGKNQTQKEDLEEER